jgi:soluble lytic murein transglycosylase-like protein
MIEDVYRVMSRINDIRSRFGLNPPNVVPEQKEKAAVSFESHLEDSKGLAATTHADSRIKREMSVDEINSLAEKIAVREGVSPTLVKKIIKAESDYDVDAVSAKGAMGLMQLMPSSAEEFGVADPFSPDENITGGVKMLKKLINSYQGDYNKAVAAYNAGKAAVDRNNGEAPFAETRDYVRKVIDAVNSDKEQ